MPRACTRAEWQPGHRHQRRCPVSFSEAISLQVVCDNQDEVDYYWKKLGENGEEGPCGCLKDRFGVSWQVTPKGLDELFTDNDNERARRAMEAMFEMKTLDLAALQAADAEVR